MTWQAASRACAALRAGLKMWRQASLPAVEGGILPPGKTVRLSKRLHFTVTVQVATRFRRAGSTSSTSAKMADATIFRQALSLGTLGHDLFDDGDGIRIIFQRFVAQQKTMGKHGFGHGIDMVGGNKAVPLNGGE